MDWELIPRCSRMLVTNWVISWVFVWHGSKHVGVTPARSPVHVRTDRGEQVAAVDRTLLCGTSRFYIDALDKACSLHVAQRSQTRRHWSSALGDAAKCGPDPSATKSS